MRKWEIGRYTLGQIANALDRGGGDDDPHAGQEEVRSMEDLERMWEEDFGE